MEHEPYLGNRSNDIRRAESYQEMIAGWGRRRRLSDGDARRATEDWQRALSVRQPVRLERIPCHQVTNERGARGCSLVGVVHDAETARIYHTRALTAEDIVHELLHVAHPAWSEEQVVTETDRLLGRCSGSRSCRRGDRAAVPTWERQLQRLDVLPAAGAVAPGTALARVDPA